MTLNISQLEIILENIRFELNLKNNHVKFMYGIEIIATGVENIFINKNYYEKYHLVLIL